MSSLLYGIAERAGILQFDAGLPRDEAEKRAICEALDAHAIPSPESVLGELIDAVRRRHDPRLADVLRASGLEAARAPTWGIARVAIEQDTYRPVNDHERGDAALVVPVIEDATIVDLAATVLGTSRTIPRLGVAEVIGADRITTARETDGPLRVFTTPCGWLRGNTLGVVIVNWRHAACRLDGLRELHCNIGLAARLHQATRSCWPVPRIVTFQTRGAHRAA